MKTASMVVLALSAAAVSVVFAQSGSADLKDAFKKLDADGNGYVTVQEAEKDRSVLEQFNRLDTNGDGRLNQQEFEAKAKKQ